MKFKINPLLHAALQYSIGDTTDEEIKNIDRTKEFYKTLIILGKREKIPININVNGLPALGKSTVAMQLGITINKTVYNKKFGIKEVVRDQSEYSQTRRSGDITYTAIVIDEWNALEQGGLGSTAEKSTLEVFSDIFAQKHISPISCSPEYTTDKNAYIFLEVIGKNQQTKTTHCKLYYKTPIRGTSYLQLLGYVNVDVSEVLGKKWYQEYRRRKFEKMNMLINEGIFRPRLLEHVGVIKAVIDRLKPFTRIQSRLITRDVIINYVKMEFRKKKIPDTLLTNEEITSSIKGTLELWKAYHSTVLKLKAAEGKTPTDIVLGIKEIEALKQMRDDLATQIGEQEKELETQIAINAKYNTIEK